ncbi:Down syndrome cell adhesion molecule-like protein Dscam2 isoform X2 [Centruroides sculpturatus]|uniref:Down syndrome cell adhesion molecule-like protein Dscam2 isoform X2 n=1 Tax=Centruroides sculpturatus TaxID=218467 RepID=UPI000C6E9472|nr:Down syndrome cell adhesion molecule-like protein Dscam2 isoform X2 [Centruroides sculpturatus]
MLNAPRFLIVALLAVSSHEAHVEGPIFLNEPPHRLDFSNSSGGELRCRGDGKPTPIVRWVKQNGDPVNEISRLRVLKADGTLIFRPFRPEDYRADVHDTIYRCLLSNIVGTIGSRDVHVRAVILQNYEIRSFDEFVLRGNMAVLRCPIPSFVSDYVRVSHWERNDSFFITPTTGDGRYGIFNKGDLYIKKVDNRDSSYSFRCHTENILTGEKKSSIKYSKVIVTEPHHSQLPRIISRSTKLTVPVRQSQAILVCIAQGYPLPTYRWYKEQGGLTPAEINQRIRQEDGVLLIQRVMPEDSGKYVCVVSNSVGEDRTEIELFVEEPLIVSLIPDHQRVDVGKTVTLNCSITGRPVGSVVWRKDMNFLPTSRRLKFLSPTLLEISQVKRQDAGIYQCFVYGETNSVQASASVVIGDLVPEFRYVYQEQTVHPRSFVSLKCVAVGNPLPQITWILDGIWPISSRAGTVVNTYATTEGDVISYVNLTSADVGDSGVYTCTATNYAGQKSHSQRLNVYGPLFVRPLSNFTVLSGKTFIISCPFGGYPYSSIIWKYETLTLPIGQHQRVFPNGTLVIADVDVSRDQGRYSCEVSNDQRNSAERTFRLIVRSGPKIAPFTFQDELHEGMRTAVTCIVVAGDGPLIIKWMKDSRLLSEEKLNASIIYGEGGFVSTLTIKKLAYLHNGNYTCVATNDLASDSYSAKLTVKVPPRWLLQPKDTSAVVGKSAMINCQASGVPQPHVRWKVATGNQPVEYRTIISSSHIHILVNGSLNIRSVEENDGGLYVCEANNGVGSGISSIIRFTVHSIPRFETKFLEKNFKKGERAEIECNADGDLPVVFLWRRNGIRFDPASEARYLYETFEEDKKAMSKIIIASVERDDSAMLTCTARNQYGEDTANIQLTIQDVPDPPQNIEINEVTSRSVRLSWSQKYTGNSPITEYIISWIPSEDMWKQSKENHLSVSGSENTATIRGLNSQTTYSVSIRALNALGKSAASIPVLATTLEEPPSKAPGSVKAMAHSSQVVNISWERPEVASDSITGYYVGYKLKGDELYTYKTVETIPNQKQEFQLSGLARFTDYSIIVQAFNSRGAGPASDEVIVRTLEYDRPTAPIMKKFFTTSTSIKLTWDITLTPSAPLLGYVLHYRKDGNRWRETRIIADRRDHSVHDLDCGTLYYFYLLAYNSAGNSEPSEMISAKTDGNSPIAPEKSYLLSVNSTTVLLHLNSWRNGGCPITFFVVQYKPQGQQEWTLVSNNIIPDQQEITITDLSPGTWYTLLMTSHNEAGSTDAEYVFATLTLTGEQPPRPAEANDVTAMFYRHLTVTVPIVSSLIVLIVVLIVVCVITRRRNSEPRPHTPEDFSLGADSNEPTKHENVPLSITYDSTQEPVYFPEPYAMSRVSVCSRDHSSIPGKRGHLETFGNTRIGYTYDIPYPPKRAEKDNPSELSQLYSEHFEKGIWTRISRDNEAIYEIPDRERTGKGTRERHWREDGDGDSSSDSDPEPYNRQDDISGMNQSEAECDRLYITKEKYMKNTSCMIDFVSF